MFIHHQTWPPIGFLVGNDMTTLPGSAVFALFSADGAPDDHRVRFIIDDAREVAAARHGRRPKRLPTSSADAAPAASSPSARRRALRVAVSR